MILILFFNTVHDLCMLPYMVAVLIASTSVFLVVHRTNFVVVKFGSGNDAPYVRSLLFAGSVAARADRLLGIPTNRWFEIGARTLELWSRSLVHAGFAFGWVLLQI